MQGREDEPRIDHCRGSHGGSAMALQAQKQPAHSSTLGLPPAPTPQFVASTEKTYDQLMTEAMNRDMSHAAYNGDPDHDFVTMMLPHRHGAIYMAKAVLLYGKDPQIRRLAQEIITDQQSEIQLMQLWLKHLQKPLQRPGLDAKKD